MSFTRSGDKDTETLRLLVEDLYRLADGLDSDAPPAANALRDILAQHGLYAVAKEYQGASGTHTWLWGRPR